MMPNFTLNVEAHKEQNTASVVAAAGHTGPGTVKVGTSVAAMSLSGGGMAPVAKVEYLSVDELLMIAEEMG